METPSTPIRRLASTGRWIGLLALAITVAACGSDGNGSSAPASAVTMAAAETAAPTSTGATTSAAPADLETEPELPVTVTDSTGAQVTITSAARIIPVDGDLAEVVYALGLGDRVVAADISATYPAEVDAVPKIGYQRALNAEPIAAFEPTVVLATDTAQPTEAIEQLRAIGYPVVVIYHEPTLAGPSAKVRAVARALGVPRRGEALVATMEAEIAEATAKVASATSRPRVVALYVRGTQTQLIFGEGSGVDAVLAAVGAVDIAAELGVRDYAELTAEAMIAARPEVIIMSTTGLESIGGLAGLDDIAGLAQSPAVRDGRVLTFEDQYLFGGGPRVGQLIADLVVALHPELTSGT